MHEIAKLEALLFQYGEPVSYRELAHLMGVKDEQLREVLAEYERALTDDARGLSLMRSEGTCELVTKKDAAPLIENMVRENFKAELTPAVLEVMTIAAYLGPVPRTAFDEIRGVNSALALRNAYVRGLIERERGKHSSVYSVSTDFLKHCGVTKQEELPQYEMHRGKLQEMLKPNN